MFGLGRERRDWWDRRKRGAGRRGKKERGIKITLLMISSWLAR